MSALSSSAVLVPLPVGAGRYRLRVSSQVGLAPELPWAFAPWLYLRPDYLRATTPAGPAWQLWLEDQQLNTTVATFPVVGGPEAGQAHSPARAPFGGIQFAPGLPPEVLQAYLAAAHAWLAQAGIRHLSLTLPPQAYAPAQLPWLVQALTALGYHIAAAPLNHHLPLAQDFAAGLHPSERRRLRKCEQAGMQFEQEPPWLLEPAYAFLQACRQERGHSLSLGLDALQQLFRDFPRDYLLFSVRDAQGAWAALTVVVRASEQVLYNFYPASPRAYNAYSPVVLLNAGLHAFGRANGCQLLDLGTSMLDDGPNFPLLRFKKHLGAEVSLKYTLVC